MRKFNNAEVLGKIIEVLDYRFRGVWHNKDFHAEDYDTCDSLTSINEITKLMRQYDKEADGE